MPRAFLAALLLTAILAAGSLAAIEWRASAAPPEPGPAPAPAGRVENPPEPAPVAWPAEPAAATTPPPVAPSAPPPAPAPAIDPAPEPRAARGPLPPPPDRALRKVVRRELTAGGLQARLARCTAGTVQRGQPAILMLELETLDGEVRIVDAAVHLRGDASPEVVSCAQDTLRDQMIPAPSATTTGARSRMPLAVTTWHRPR